MSEQKWLIVTALVLVVFAGVLYTEHPSSGQPTAGQSIAPKVAGQVPVVGAVGRYQISSFLVDRSTPGAYIIDTQTGELMQVIGRDEPGSNRIGGETLTDEVIRRPPTSPSPLAHAGAFSFPGY